MSAYCVDASLHQPTEVSTVANIELIDAYGIAVKQERIRLLKGIGEGQFFVSPDIRSGDYTLRAYTSWMKNFDSEFIFERQISILNPSATLPKDSAGVSPDSNIALHFFPEGGDLVNGLKSKVALQIFTANDHHSGLKIAGLIFDNEDNEVAKFITSDRGYASFSLLPKRGKTYSARIKSDSSILSFDLPKAKNSGLTMRVSKTSTDDFKVNLDASPNFQKRVYFIIHTRGILRYAEQIDLTRFEYFIIPKIQLNEGISHITIMDDNFNPLAERLIFKYPEVKEVLEVDLNRSYANRQKVDLVIAANHLEASEKIAKISVSVFQKTGSTGNDIISNLFLTSDLKGNIVDPWLYFDPKNNSRESQLDLLMLTHGWRRFSWEKVMKGEKMEAKYPAEISSPLLTGQLKRNDQGLLPQSLTVNIPGQESFISSVPIKEEGYFSFEIPFRASGQQLLFNANGSIKLEQGQIEIMSPFFVTSQKLNPIHSFPLASRKVFEQLNVNIQLAQIYREFSKINGVNTHKHNTSTRFYGRPDHTYQLDNYTRFETITDLFIEYIRAAFLKKRKGQLKFFVFNNKSEKQIPALLLLDDVPIEDTDFILGFDPLKLKTIEVVEDTYLFNGTSAPSLINFITYDGNLGGVSLPQYVLEKTYQGIQTPREFYSPDYSVDHEKLKRIPDYRNTLYWNPKAMVGDDGRANFEFYTADQAGTYQVEINGITDQGRVIYLNKSFDVNTSLSRK
ncbi:MAG: hypothetical protein AAF519_17130 [Bacteroidota bacterium]